MALFEIPYSYASNYLPTICPISYAPEFEGAYQPYLP